MQRTDLRTQWGKERGHELSKRIDIVCVQQPASAKLPSDPGSSAGCSVTTQRGEMGMKQGGRFKRRGHVYPYGGFELYGRNQRNIVKQLSSN